MNEFEETHQIDIDFDDDLNGFLVLKCLIVGTTKRIPLSEIHPGYTHKCECTANIHFTGDDISELQRAFDDLKRSLSNFKISL